MQTYISLLRGINVSGQKLIKMETLKSVYISLGFKQVVSYIQSGNLIFQYKNSSTKKLEAVLKEKIKQEFDFDVSVLVLTMEALKAIIKHNPFLQELEKDPAFFHISFLSEVPDTQKLSALLTNAFLPDMFIYKNQVLYLYCPNGYGKTKLTNTFFEKKLQVQVTTRNWKTVETLLKLSALKD